MAGDRSDILTAAEVAAYLRLHVATVYRLAQAGELPAVRVGNSWRFSRDLLDEWFRKMAMARYREI